jgi:membrane-associated phospholipid phosphatase
LIALSQQSSYSQVLNDLESDFNYFIKTGVSLSSDFIKFNKSTQINFAGSALLVAAGYSLDNNVKNFSQNNLSKFNDRLFSIDNVYGSGYTLLGIGGIYGYGLLFRDKEIRKIGLQTIEAVGYAGTITSVLKSLAGRSRPYNNEGKARFRPIDFNAGHTSFPSGHSTVSFAVSTVLANNTDKTYLKVFYYSASTLVACARIYRNAHWFSDVIAGSLIGHFAGEYVSDGGILNKTDNDGLSIGFSPTGIDLSLAF